MRFFLIHGAYGNPEENWFPWLEKQLTALGAEVFVPEFPTPENQSLSSWLGVFEHYMGAMDSETCFVAHSLGPAFVLSVLERAEIKVKACFFVAPFVSNLGLKEFDRINTSFYRQFDWSKIKQNCEKFVVLYSNNDPYVSANLSQEVAKNLNAEIIEVKGAGHFNEKAGYKQFPLLLEKIKQLL